MSFIDGESKECTAEVETTTYVDGGSSSTESPEDSYDDRNS
jgi:hypothetical protein